MNAHRQSMGTDAFDNQKKTGFRFINVGRSGVFNGLFGNPIVEKKVSPQYREHFQKLMVTHPDQVEWLRRQIGDGVELYCPRCGWNVPTCHARIIEQEIAFS